MRCRRATFVTPCLVIVILSGGCADPKAPVTYTMSRPPGPLDEIRGLLRRYSEGQPVGSEVTTFEGLVAGLRQTDADRADVVAEGLTKIAETPRSAAMVARRLLAELDGEPPSAR